LYIDICWEGITLTFAGGGGGGRESTGWEEAGKTRLSPHQIISITEPCIRPLKKQKSAEAKNKTVLI
jgi:hypothetical protein